MSINRLRFLEKILKETRSAHSNYKLDEKRTAKPT